MPTILKAETLFDYTGDRTKFDTDHLKSISDTVQNILNIIIEEMCNAEKENKSYSITYIAEKIEKIHSNYLKLCSKAPTSGTDCADGTQIFTSERINNIMNQIKQNSDFKRSCILKHSIGEKIYYGIYPDSYYLWMEYTPEYKIIHTGGRPFKHKKNIKFINFESFLRQYEDYNLINTNENINVVRCEGVNGKITCVNKINTNEYNVNTMGKDEKMEKAMLIYKKIKNAKSVSEALNILINTNDEILYFILPVCTITEYKKVKNNVSNN